LRGVLLDLCEVKMCKTRSCVTLQIFSLKFQGESGKENPSRSFLSEIPKTRYSDLGGIDSVLQVIGYSISGNPCTKKGFFWLLNVTWTGRQGAVGVPSASPRVVLMAWGSAAMWHSPPWTPRCVCVYVCGWVGGCGWVGEWVGV
jgi:hypothetical protein